MVGCPTPRSTLRYALVLLGLAFSAACVRTVTVSDVPGEYVATYPFGSDRIVLYPSGTFVQEVNVTRDNAGGNAEKLSHEGRWVFSAPDNPMGSGSVRLDSCLSLADGLGTLRSNFRTPLVCVYPVEREWLLGKELRLGGSGSGEYPHTRK
jgi:hypothetical protein